MGRYDLAERYSEFISRVSLGNFLEEAWDLIELLER